MSPLKVWSKFTAKKGGTAINLRILDAPEILFEEIINQYMKYYVTEDPIFKVAGVPKSAAAMEELRVSMLEGMKEEGFHTVVCCLDNGDDLVKQVLGASMMVLTSKADPEPELEYKTEEMKMFFEMYCGMASYYDEAKALKSDRFFSDQGIFVSPEYRGLGVEVEFLKTWHLISKEHGIPVSGAWMTSPETQKGAELEGWETAYEIQYQELGKKLGVTFEGDPPSTKFMIAKIN